MLKAANEEKIWHGEGFLSMFRGGNAVPVGEKQPSEKNPTLSAEGKIRTAALASII